MRVIWAELAFAQLDAVYVAMVLHERRNIESEDIIGGEPNQRIHYRPPWIKKRPLGISAEIFEGAF